MPLNKETKVFLLSILSHRVPCFHYIPLNTFSFFILFSLYYLFHLCQLYQPHFPVILSSTIYKIKKKKLMLCSDKWEEL